MQSVLKLLLLLLQGWNVFSKVANVAKENALKYGSLASQKVVEVSSTVTDKVDCCT